jgi:hypothetical protein
MRSSGLTTTTGGILADRQIIEMQNEIYQYDPNATPLLSILSQTASGSKASAVTYNHLEDEPLPSWDTLGSDLSSNSTTTVAVAHGTYFRAGDLVLIPKSLANSISEVVLVSSVSSNNLTVIRDWVSNNAGVGGTAAVSGDNVTIIGNVNEEGSGTRTVLTTAEVKVTNYCQIIKTPWEISGSLDATALYGGPDAAYQAKKMASQHAFEQERAFLFGTKRSTTSTSSTARGLRATGGIYYWLTTNKVAAGGTLTHSHMESLAQKVFRFNTTGEALLLCGRTVMTQLDNIAEARIETVVASDTYGVKMRRYVTGHGDFMIKIHDLLINDYAGVAIAVDMSNIQKRFTVNHEGKRDALLRMNIQSPDADSQKAEYLSEVGLHVHREKAHGLLTGVA